MKQVLSCAVAFCVALFSASAFGQATGSAAGGAIPDNDAGGLSTVVNVSGAAAGATITDVEIIVDGLTHTWVGDLIFSIQSPDGTTADLINRVGDDSAVAGGFGDSSDLGGTYTFSDDGGDFWGAAIAVDGATAIAPGDFAATSVGVGTATAGTPVNLASVFNSATANGNWTFFISDNGAGDTGTFTNVTINLETTAVPEPASVAVLGLFGLGLISRRRR